jgi:hypothetical protein
MAAATYRSLVECVEFAGKAAGWPAWLDLAGSGIRTLMICEGLFDPAR